MQFLKLLESIRNPFFDFIFSLITHLGEETVFLAVAIFIFWCVNKREGYYILITGLVGTVINQALKLTFRIDRPWVKDPSFTIVERARAEATGFSFPSGHTQNVAGTFGGLATFAKRKWLKITFFVLVALVGFSRMYLGVHTPYDVAASLLIASLLLFVLDPIFSSEERFHKAMPYVIGICAILSVGLIVYVNLLPESDFAAEALTNLVSGKKNGATLIGCMLGLAVVYPVDRLYSKFTTEGVWYSQLIKLAVGLGIVLGLKSGLKAPLEWLVGLLTEEPEYIARGIRYFLIVIFAGVVWPLTFSRFAALRIGFMDRFSISFTEKMNSLTAKVKSALVRK